jgi:hypothetical protein
LFPQCLLHDIKILTILDEDQISGTCTTLDEDEKVYKILAGKPDGRRPLRRPRRRWKNSIKMDLKEIVWKGMD